MFARSPRDLGLMIRERRRALGLDQSALAERVGVSRQWVIDIEKGKPRAPLELVLRALAALELELDIKPRKQPVAGSPELDLNQVVARARGKTT